MRRPPVPIDPIGGIEGGEIHLRDGIDHEPREMPSGSHSRKLGADNNSCSRSHPMKFCAIPESS
jgi:hypothetical protein